MAELRGSERLWNSPLLGCTLAVVIAGTLALFSPNADAQDNGQSTPRSAFEVASVKPHIAGSGGGRSNPGRFVGAFSVTVLVTMAYRLQSGHQLVRPAWADTLFLDIEAKLPEGATKEQIPRMLQTLLADRLKLAAHEESRIMPVYELTVGSAGPKMKTVDPSKFSDEILRFPPNRGFRGHLTMPQIAYLLSDGLDRYVLDSTGLSGVYDVDVRWTPAEADTVAGASEPLPAASEPSGLFRAIQEQLGLKLESRRAPVRVVVVDHVERAPTAN